MKEVVSMVEEIKKAQKVAIVPAIVFSLGFLFVIQEEPFIQFFGLLLFLIPVLFLILYGCKHWEK